MMRLEQYQQINTGHLEHSGHNYETLAQTYGTPLYIFDETSFRDRVQSYKQAVSNDYFETEVLFASKALLTKAIARLIAELGIGQDVVSAGEIYTGVQNGVPADKMYFHGNNKLDSELEYALGQGVGTIVVDNRMEIQRVNRIAAAKGKQQRVLLRLNPGIEAHTHEYIMTANNDSKFGENVHDEAIDDVIVQLVSASNLKFVGFHSHIGSQIFEAESFLQAATALLEFAAKVQMEHRIQIQEMNFGGGFGVYYTEEDQPFNVTEFLPEFMEHVHIESQRLMLKLNKVSIEPGRSLVNASGSTLYRVGDLKTTVGGKNFLFVDGSMNDNIRPALYQAKYEAILTEKAEGQVDTTYTVAGKACESGDVIIDEIKLPKADTGDLLLVNGTGAYNYTMASNYNRLSKPAMIHIYNEEHYLTVRRETFEDMARNEI